MEIIPMDNILLLVATTLLLLGSTILWQLFHSLVWRPYALTKFFRKQGISGPSYKFLSGSLDEMNSFKSAAKPTVFVPINSDHDAAERACPHYHKWFSQYGETFLYWIGVQPRICISDPEMAKQILSTKFGFYPKPTQPSLIRKMIGDGLALINGEDWVNHKRIVNPAFNMEKLKGMINRIADCTFEMLDDWKLQAGNGDGVIDVKKEFQKLTADVIAHIAFGSSYVEGTEVFKAQRELQHCYSSSMTDVSFPGSQFLPTPKNLQIWKQERKLKSSLRQIIESRLTNRECRTSNSYYENDLLGLMIESLAATGTKVDPKMKMDEIIEECKTFFFAGHETTSNLLIWTVFLLSINPDWQEKLREEVMRECGVNIPDADILSKLKLVNMVLLESLRLYCPVISIARQASQDMRLGNLVIPKDIWITIPLVMIHKMEKHWGKDAKQFNPLRFADGVSKAGTHPNAFLAFAMGPRACIGQTFTMMEAKTVMALLLQRFSFTLSPDYKHAPTNHLTLQPLYGIPIILKQI